MNQFWISYRETYSTKAILCLSLIGYHADFVVVESAPMKNINIYWFMHKKITQSDDCDSP